MNDDTRQPESETEEPVFQSDDQDSSDREAEPKSDSPLAPANDSEPSFVPDAESDSAGEAELPAPVPAEPVFSAGGASGASQDSEYRQEIPEPAHEPAEWEFAPAEPVLTEEAAGGSTESSFGQQAQEYQSTEAADVNWVNIAPDSETEDKPRLETEYNFFDETPAAQVAAAPPPTRKLGRTGPVWVLGGIALVLIAGLVWLGITRLMGTSENSTVAPSEPTVQQVAADAPTPEPPTSTPGPTPTPTPILLPINANVTVANTDGQGVLLRAGPGRAGEFIQTVEEGETMVVLAADPESEHADYPVSLDGYLWYRMRVPGMLDEDGNPLVGWSASNFFVVDVQ